jgi:D-arabinose 1-dehydrogenase-like Zn-dependent alcohol dehydrogenase
VNQSWEVKEINTPGPGENQVLIKIAAAGKVKVMAETYSLDEITKAYERVAEGKVRFRAVITPGN